MTTRHTREDPADLTIIRDSDAITIIWDPEVVSPGQYAKLVTLLGDLVRAEGGAGIERVRSVDMAVSREER